MRRDNTRSIAEIIKELIEAYKLDDKLIESKIIQSWESIVGNYIASKTSKLFIHDHKLYVGIQSSIIKHELMIASDDFLEKINEIAGKKYIEKIIFI